MGDGQRGGTLAGQVLDQQRVPARGPPEGEPEVVAGPGQADLEDVAVAPALVVDQEQAVAPGLGLAEDAAPDRPVAPGPGVEPELADDLQAGDVGELDARGEVLAAGEAQVARAGSRGTRPRPSRPGGSGRSWWSSAPGPWTRAGAGGWRRPASGRSRSRGAGGSGRSPGPGRRAGCRRPARRRRGSARDGGSRGAGRSPGEPRGRRLARGPDRHGPAVDPRPLVLDQADRRRARGPGLRRQLAREDVDRGRPRVVRPRGRTRSPGRPPCPAARRP